MADDRLIGHLIGELRQVTDLRIELAQMREWRRMTDRRLGTLETTSHELRSQLLKQSREGLIPTLLRTHAIALMQWGAFIVVMGLSAAKLLPPWLAPLISALAPDK